MISARATTNERSSVWKHRVATRLSPIKQRKRRRVTAIRALQQQQLKRQSLYTLWNVIRFLIIGGFVLLEARAKQRSLQNFYNNTEQCCYCLINAFVHTESTKSQMEWTVCETHFGEQSCHDSNVNKVCKKKKKRVSFFLVKIIMIIITMKLKEEFSCGTGIIVGWKRHNYSWYGWTALIIAMLYCVVLYTVTRCYPSLHTYILAYNTFVSMICLYCLLQVCRFSLMNNHVTDNSYGPNANVDSGCYRDTFSPSLVWILDMFAYAAILIATFPLALFDYCYGKATVQGQRNFVCLLLPETIYNAAKIRVDCLRSLNDSRSNSFFNCFNLELRYHERAELSHRWKYCRAYCHFRASYRELVRHISRWWLYLC
ncbi:hypothetical protein RFI_13708 [Reticulomyxa filosa]|uniref:Uncharacterized protein n=1 Tax=Reticulomyxa filosa TaxID=46433 RepID=X6NB12_RETFI|nr:hypothetical protein RFI_13708 [Reticulomyxa filosa]|eukprot:ETO23470.1 hypothetical protein RFI_13708 [Reticulomyxa filosa]